MLYLLIAASVAQPLLITSEELSDKEQRIVDRYFGVEADIEQLSWRRLQNLHNGYQFSGEGQLYNCQNQSSNNMQIVQQIQRLQHAVNYIETEDFFVNLQKTIDILVCSEEKVSSSVLANIKYLEGIAHCQVEDRDKAEQAWREALFYYPNLEWDKNIEPTGKDIFDYVKLNLQYEAPTTLQLYGADPNMVYVNGRQLSSSSLELYEGFHLIQDVSDPIKGYGLQVPAGKWIHFATLSGFPASFSEVLKDELENPTLHQALTVLYPEREAYLLMNNKIWQKTEKGWEVFVHKDQKRRKLLLSSTMLMAASGLYAGSYMSFQQFHSEDVALADLDSLQQQTNILFAGAVISAVGSAAIVATGK
jgi:hypothetical protein